MTDKRFYDLSNADLIDEFVRAAALCGKASFEDDVPTMRRASYRMRALDDVFKTRDLAVRSLLLQYLQHPDEGVRYWSAKRLLPIAALEARACIQRIATGIGPIAGAAGMTLLELDRGVFKPETLWGPLPVD